MSKEIKLEAMSKRSGKTRDQVKQLLKEKARSPEHRADPFWFSRMLSRYDHGLELE